VFVEGASGGGGDRKWFEMPGVDGHVAKLAAFDTNTMREVWNVPLRASLLTGVLTTRTGVAFVGDVNRYFRAYDVQTGKQLWQVRLGTSVQGFPISFKAGGKQYVAVSTGVGGGSPRRVPLLLTREIHYPIGGNALYVFELPEVN
jgi:alcohol dehydrogenase (cytochrome c)